MARPREFDIDQVLDAAMNTFWTKGYEATSMADLMEAMNLKKGSIYKAFEDKHDLFCKALERYLEGMDKQMREMVETATSPRAGIETWLQKGVEMCQGQGVKRGCLALNTAVELGPHDCQSHRDTQRPSQAHDTHVERNDCARPRARPIPQQPSRRPIGPDVTHIWRRHVDDL
jgi:AcrR family transcriptional regulator